MVSDINSGRCDMVTKATFVMRTIPYKHTKKRLKINFMMIVGLKKGITKATKIFEKIIMRSTIVK